MMVIVIFSDLEPDLLTIRNPPVIGPPMDTEKAPSVCINTPVIETCPLSSSVAVIRLIFLSIIFNLFLLVRFKITSPQSSPRRCEGVYWYIICTREST